MNDPEIIALARQSERWLYAAQQDRDLVVKNLHLNYGVGDLDILAEATTPEHLRALTGIDLTVAREAARAEQDRTQQQLILLVQQGQAADHCPSLPSSNSAYDFVTGKPGAWLIVLRDLFARSGLVGLGMFVAGERENLVRNALAGGIGIEVFVLGWIWLHAPARRAPELTTGR